MKTFFILLLVALTLGGCSAEEKGRISAPDYSSLSPCEKDVSAAIQYLVDDSLCGSVIVFEDREAGDGRTIDLNVMVIPAIAEYPNPDPIFFLAGGPGQSAVSVGPYLFAREADWRRQRDVVLVDQRGTGESNSLACVDGNFDQFDLTLTVAEAQTQFIAQLRDCLTTVDADPALYTTNIAMDDLNQVRETFGIAQVNLMGISYGTRAALVYLRRHGDSVRSMVLDAVAPTTMVIPGRVAKDADNSFMALVKACESDTACQQTFPDLTNTLAALLIKLEAEEVFVDSKHPLTSEIYRARLEPESISRLVRLAMYSRDLARLVPYSLLEAEAGNYDPLLGLGLSFGNDDTAMSIGMMASVLCAEDMQRVSSANETALFDNPLYDLLAPVCEFWPSEPVDPAYFDPVQSDVPVLLTSGSLDPITPPRYAFEAMATLSNAEHLVVPGGTHGVIQEGCMPEVVGRFIETASIKNLGTGCSINIEPAGIFLSSAGPVAKPAKESTTP